MIGRDDLDWDMRADLRRRPEDKPWTGFRLLVRDDAGVAQGWANYEHKEHWVDMRPQATAEVVRPLRHDAGGRDPPLALPRRARPRRHGQGGRSPDRRDPALAARQRPGRQADVPLRLRVGAAARRPGPPHRPLLHGDRTRRPRDRRRPGHRRRSVRPRRVARRSHLRRHRRVGRHHDVGPHARHRVARRRARCPRCTPPGGATSTPSVPWPAPTRSSAGPVAPWCNTWF